MSERYNRPSCSGLYRYANCPASFLLSFYLPNKAGPDAESGTRIHKWLEEPTEENAKALTHDESVVAGNCLNHRDELLRVFFDNFPYPILNQYKERRLSMMPDGHVADACNPVVISGKADVIIHDGEKGIVIDYKTGRGEQEHAMDNDQLRGLAVLAARRWGLKWVRVAIVQPLAGPPTVADYDTQALERAYDWLRHTIAASDAAAPEDAKAGPWCQYCPAAKNNACEAFRSSALSKTYALTGYYHPPTREKIAERAQRLNNAAFQQHLDNLQLVEWYVDAIRADARRRLEAGETLPGWRLHTTKPRETITDVARVWDNLAPHYCTPSEFAEVCSITKSKLKPLVARLRQAKGKALEMAMAEATAGAITIGEPTVRLERTKGGAELEEGE